MTETGGDKGSKAERLGYLGLGMMGIPMATAPRQRWF